MESLVLLKAGSYLVLFFTLCGINILLQSRVAHSATRYFEWTVQYATVTRLCHTKSVLSINGQFPGPNVYVTEGDHVVVKVTNLVANNITIHWHGVRQFMSCWADGVAYITQCPIQFNQTYTHRFDVVGQRGTLLWHAHNSWQRATLYGAFIIRPKLGAHQRPFPKPDEELPPLLIGEWWNGDVEEVIANALATGGKYNYSDALTINGGPGLLYNCSEDDVGIYNVEYGKTYLLPVINAALNFQVFFGIANHSLTVVEADAEYTAPHATDTLVLAPGQTLSVMFRALSSLTAFCSRFFMAASIYSSPPRDALGYVMTPATAILNYADDYWLPDSTDGGLPLPNLPAHNDSAAAFAFYDSLRSQQTPASSAGNRQPPVYYYMDVPREVELELLYTVGYAFRPCDPPGSLCPTPSGLKIATHLNNISFVQPSMSILQAYYNNAGGVFEANFPDGPTQRYNYTGSRELSLTERGTRVRVVAYNSTVQVVFQNTVALLPQESHPIHLHGHNFWVVGTGHGNYDPATRPASSFNLLDPPSRNTIVVPAAGWAAVRFRATNPGVWFLHCHFDIHQSWGMAMAFVVLDGENCILPPPPNDLPHC